MSDPDLIPRDVAIFWCLLSEMNHSNGKVCHSPSSLSSLIKEKQSTIALSFGRLKKKLLIIPRRDPRTKASYMRLNPDAIPACLCPKKGPFRAEWLSELEDEYGGDRQKALDRLLMTDRLEPVN